MMETGSSTEQVGVRCERYLAELREFFRSSGMRSGSSENLAQLTERLQQDGVFRDELTSMSRSIVFREGGSLPPVELLSLLSVAIGGAQVEDHAQEIHAEIGKLLHFSTEVLRRPANQALGESSPSGAAYIPSDRMPASSGPAISDAPSTGGAAGDGLEEAETRLPSPWKTAQGFLPRWRTWWWIPAAGVAIAATALMLPRRHTHAMQAPVEAVQNTAPAVETRSAEGPTKPVREIAASSADGATPPTTAPAAGHSGTVVEQAKLPVGAEKRSQKGLVSRGVTAPAARANTAAPGGVSYASAAHRESRSRPAHVPRATASVRPFSMERTRAAAGPEHSPPGPVARASEAKEGGVRGLEGSSVHKLSGKKRVLGTLEVSSGVMSANLLSARPPEYPRMAGVMHLQGAVILQAVIGKNGQVLTTHVLRGHYLLRGAAEKAVRTWRYRPFMANGHPVDVATVVTVDFRRNH